MTERYIDRHELAGLLGVSVRTVYAWQCEGMPSELWGQRMRRFQPSACVAWLQSRRKVCENDGNEKVPPATVQVRAAETAEGSTAVCAGA